jgi:predicted nucleic acid-binding Zn ribbon protein
MSSPAIKKCPVCGKNKVKRLIGTGAGLIFKGSGFYITDYRSDAYKASAKGDAAPAAATDAPKTGDAKPAETPKPAETKSGEAKPAAKSDSPPPAPKAESKPQAKKSAEKSSK